MNASSILSSLAPLLVNADANAQLVAADATRATQQFKAGQLSQSEYQEIIADLASEQLINIGASALVAKQALYSLFTAISNATSLLPI